MEKRARIMEIYRSHARVTQIHNRIVIINHLYKFASIVRVGVFCHLFSHSACFPKFSAQNSENYSPPSSSLKKVWVVFFVHFLLVMFYFNQQMIPREMVAFHRFIVTLLNESFASFHLESWHLISFTVASQSCNKRDKIVLFSEFVNILIYLNFLSCDALL